MSAEDPRDAREDAEPAEEPAIFGASRCRPPCGRAASAHPTGWTSVDPAHVRAVRLGHGANCSSVGSVVDTLFLGAVVGGAIFAAICAALRDEPVRVVASPGADDDAPPPGEEAS
jgi:hypothetical protein